MKQGKERVFDMGKGCWNCKHSKLATDEEPCVNCTIIGFMDNDAHRERTLLWEAKEGTSEEVIHEHNSVNHPSHYCQEGSMECIDEMVAVFGVEAVMHFCLLNVWKYRKRAIFKNGEEDMQKADWYMKKYIELKGDMYERE